MTDRRYPDRRQQGLCGACNNPSTAGYCEACLARRAAAQRERRAAQKRHGLCPTCGKKKAAKGKTNCTPCQNRNNELSRASHAVLSADRRAQGLCRQCGARSPLTSYCSVCAAAKAGRVPGS